MSASCAEVSEPEDDSTRVLLAEFGFHVEVAKTRSESFKFQCQANAYTSGPCSLARAQPHRQLPVDVGSILRSERGRA